jgi:hypothetical protein
MGTMSDTTDGYIRYMQQPIRILQAISHDWLTRFIGAA